MPPRCRTTIFAKEPRAGTVKTRLCPPLTPAQAAELAWAMLDDSVAALCGEAGLHASLCIASEDDPAAAVARMRARYPGLEVSAQVGHGLGERLAQRFDAHAREHPGQPLVCIGADAPQLPIQRVRDAHRRLADGVDLVLGPDTGGGYHLIGLARAAPELFTEVAMSTDDMFARTLELARELELSVALVAEGYDIDVEADLSRLARELATREHDARAAPFPRATAAFLARLFPEPRP